MFSAISERRKRRGVTAAFFFLSGIITASWSSRIPEVQHRLGLDNARWGVVLFSLYAGQISGLPLSSWAVSKYGSRLMMIAAMIGYACLLCLLGASAHAWQLAPLLFLFGIFRNGVNISINTNALEVQRFYERPIVSTFHGLWSLACFVSAGIGTLMIARGVLPPVHFVLMAALVSVAVFLVKGKKSGTGEKVARRPFFIAPDHYLFLLGLMAFCAMICEGTMFDWSVNYFRQEVGAAKGQVTLGYTSFILAMTFGRLVGDRVIARLGPLAVLMANGLIMAAGFFTASLFPYLLPASAGFLLVGLGDSIVIPLVYTQAILTKKMPAAYAIASVTMIGYAGFLSGPLLVGSISNSLGMHWAFALMGLLTLTITFLAMRVRRLRAQEEALLGSKVT